MTRRLSTATAQDIAMLASTYELMKSKSPDDLDRLAEIAQERLNLSVRFSPGRRLAAAEAEAILRVPRSVRL